MKKISSISSKKAIVVYEGFLYTKHSKISVPKALDVLEKKSWRSSVIIKQSCESCHTTRLPIETRFEAKN